jgi:hypothetical protein
MWVIKNEGWGHVHVLDDAGYILYTIGRFATHFWISYPRTVEFAFDLLSPFLPPINWFIKWNESCV